MQKHSNTSRVETLTGAALVQAAASWRQVRAIRAAQSYYQYQLGASDPTRAVVVSPPKLDAKTGEWVSDHYTLDFETRRCSCPDQAHLDRLNDQLRRENDRRYFSTTATDDDLPEPVECKHFTIWALLIVRQAEREEAERAERRERAAAVAARTAYQPPRQAPRLGSEEWNRQVARDFD